MTQSFGIDVATIDDAGIEAGLDALAQPPDWLVAIEDLTRLRADLERTIPELPSGELHLAACKFKRAHIENGTYTSLCRLRIEDRDGGSSHDVDVHGVLVLPWMDAPSAPATRSGFEALNWHMLPPGSPLGDQHGADRHRPAGDAVADRPGSGAGTARRSRPRRPWGSRRHRDRATAPRR